MGCRCVTAEETLGDKGTMTVFDKKWCNDACKTIYIHPFGSFLNPLFLLKDDGGLGDGDFFASTSGGLSQQLIRTTLGCTFFQDYTAPDEHAEIKDVRKKPRRSSFL